MAKDQGDAAIVKTILGIADQMNPEVLVEGVETHDRLSFLRSNGYRDHQGYLGRPPLSQAALLAELRQSQRLRLVP